MRFSPPNKPLTGLAPGLCAGIVAVVIRVIHRASAKRYWVYARSWLYGKLHGR